MAPVSLEYEVRYLPILGAFSHIAAAAYLTYTVGFGLYRSYNALPPAQDTRHRIHRRRVLAPIFGGLALLALASDIYYKLGYLTLSYKVWADERGVAFPESVFTTTSNGTTRAPLYLARWLTDTPIYLDAAEIVAEKARRFWWGNQRALATVPWSMLLAIEGRRRNIPYLWAYLSLAHLVNLSFAQNLFYLALLLAPSPLDSGLLGRRSRISRALDALFPTKPPNWCPHPILFLAFLAPTYITLFLLPYSPGTSAFSPLTLLSRALTFAPLLLPALVPSSWGTVHPHPHAAYGVYTRLFRGVAAASALLHAKASVAAVRDNLPGSWRHRHSLRVPFDVVYRSNWERTTTAVGKVLGSIGDHPIVAGVAVDVLIAAVGLGVWVATRGTGVDGVLGAVVPYYEKVRYGVVHVAEGVQDGSARVGREVAAVGRGIGDVVKAGEERVEEEIRAVFKKEEDDEEEKETPTVRRSGRNGRARVASGSVKEEGDTPASSTRRRGRPKKVKPEPEPEEEEEAKTEGAAGHDATYVPEPRVAAEAAEGDRFDEEDDWESAAVAWGITALGGLGTGCAGVFGGECVAR